MKNKTIQASGNATLGAWQELNVGPVIPGATELHVHRPAVELEPQVHVYIYREY
jgi:hypothetical protein